MPSDPRNGPYYASPFAPYPYPASPSHLEPHQPPFHPPPPHAYPPPHQHPHPYPLPHHEAARALTNHGGDDDDEFDQAYQRFTASRSDYNEPLLQPYKVKIVQYGHTPAIKGERSDSVGPLPDVRADENNKRPADDKQRRGLSRAAEMLQDDAAKLLSERAKGKQRSRDVDEPATRPSNPARQSSAQPALPNGTAHPARIDPGPAHPPYALYPRPPHDTFATYSLHAEPSHYPPPPPEYWPHYSSAAFDTPPHAHAPYPVDPRYALPSPWPQPHAEMAGIARYHPDLPYGSGAPYPSRHPMPDGTNRSPSNTEDRGGHADRENSESEGQDEAEADAGASGSGSGTGIQGGRRNRKATDKYSKQPRSTPQTSSSSRPRSDLAKTLLSRRGEGKRRIVAKEDRSYGALLLHPDTVPIGGPASNSTLDHDDGDDGASGPDASALHAQRMSRARSVAAPRSDATRFKRSRSVGASLLGQEQGGAAAQTTEVATLPVKRKRGRPPKVKTLPPPDAAAATDSVVTVVILEPTSGLLHAHEMLPQYPETHTLFVDLRRRQQKSPAAAVVQGDAPIEKRDDEEEPPHWARWTWSVPEPANLFASSSSSGNKAAAGAAVSTTANATDRRRQYETLLRTQYRARRSKRQVDLRALWTVHLSRHRQRQGEAQPPANGEGASRSPPISADKDQEPTLPFLRRNLQRSASTSRVAAPKA
ncbi:hypothetical protein ACQY0O_007808 [Thecaphora frezii]